MLRLQSCHPLDPLSATEISVAVTTVKAAVSSTHEGSDDIQFMEVVLLEPNKSVVALADAYFFSPHQGPEIMNKLPPRRAKLILYNKRRNETSIWIVELAKVQDGHDKGKVISSEVIPDVQPYVDIQELVDCEALMKSYPPFIEAMMRRGIDDMDLVSSSVTM
ncbi:PREDICTED: uncharacterized protein LOC109160659 [Ipomoea nil]|uniref:uncharacterized protein LOC109160659 n=1 Tax=Ipomoea nil TaxID=35883 RepID=UPI000900B0F4|nr:PREDICTED: uncharacterized protein LOC109160659 [Ipomoea nil]